jgi:hypothetical protein
MGKNIAVEGCELEDETGGGSVDITSDASTYVLADGKGIYFGDVSIAVSGSDGGGSIGDGNGAGSGTISGTADYVLSGGQKALLEGDTATIKVSGTTTSGNVVTPVKDVSVTVKVKKAGQSVVVAL